MTSEERPSKPKQRPENGNKGWFKPGNPGRPAGSRHRVTMAVEELLEGDATKLTRKCIKAALAGDMTAMRLCMERLAPPRKGRPVRFEMPEISGAMDVQKASAAILKAVADGDLSPDEAHSIMSVLESMRRAVETAEIAGRLEAIERAMGLGER